MKTIKTRKKGRDIKAINKTVNLSARMKNAYIRTKKTAAGRQQPPRHSSPAEYASGKIQNTAQGAANQAIRRLRNPHQKARANISRAKKHFQEVRLQMPNERKRSAEQAQRAANTAKSNANQAKETARKTKSALKDAKQILRKTRYKAKHSIKLRQNGKTLTNSPNIPAKSAPLEKSTSKESISRPKSAGNDTVNPAKPINLPQTPAEPTKKTTNPAVPTVKPFKNIRGKPAHTVKTAKKTVKTAERTAHTANQTVNTARHTAKTVQKSAQAAAKSAKAAEKTARAAAKTAVRTTKAAAKAVTAMVKAAIAAVKGLIAAVAAGGWIAVTVILIICMIAMLFTSAFGIFFSNEPAPVTGMTVKSVIAEIETEYTERIDGIIDANPHDTLDISGARTAWKDILAVFSVKTAADPDNPLDSAIMDDKKAKILHSVFWDMNQSSHWTETVARKTETGTSYEHILHISVTAKTPNEIAEHYRFTGEQNEWLAELLKPEYGSLWNALLYGSYPAGSGSILEVAVTQIGNIGGELYWSWYGFTSRVAWCAAFVSWVADQCGYIDAGVIPLFALCDDGIRWFKDQEQWQNSGYTPSPGDIIFFDWNGDGISDHVGIVEFADGAAVHTIEGNTNDSCARRSYSLNSADIMGYGVPLY
jgi:hypothetical protein